MEKERKFSKQYGSLDRTKLDGKADKKDTDKSNEDRQREEELLQQIHKLVETRDFLVDDVEFERLREREEDKEMADFLQSKFPKTSKKKNVTEDRRMTSKAQQTLSTPFVTKTGLTLLKECCGFTCSVM
ncbi:unnamed protein product [Coregonus sp. 'balchen']|nr:unnamed protein product [Coregonus sp. 'balchen']